MKHPKEVHPEARALLVMTTGHATAGLPSLLEQYGYRVDDTNTAVWQLENEASGAALVFSDDWTEVALTGDSRENAENVNYVLSRGGWSSAELITADAAIEEELLSVLASIEITDIHQLWKPSEAQGEGIARPHSSSPENFPEEEKRQSSAVEALEESVGELQTALSSVEKLEEKLRILAEDNQRLKEEAENLRRQLRNTDSTATHAVPVEDQSLIPVMEKHLLRQLDLTSMESSELVNELRNAGYQIKLSLEKR